MLLALVVLAAALGLCAGWTVRSRTDSLEARAHRVAAQMRDAARRLTH
jgi:HAMP domain-containing protein